MEFKHKLLSFNELNTSLNELQELEIKAINNNREFNVFKEYFTSERFEIEIKDNKKSITKIEGQLSGNKFKGTVYSIYPELKTFKTQNHYKIIGSRKQNEDKSNEVNIYYILDLTNNQLIPKSDFATLTNATWIIPDKDVSLLEYKNISKFEDEVSKYIYVEKLNRKFPINSSFNKIYQFSKERKDFNAIFRKCNV